MCWLWRLVNKWWLPWLLWLLRPRLHLRHLQHLHPRLLHLPLKLLSYRLQQSPRWAVWCCPAWGRCLTTHSRKPPEPNAKPNDKPNVQRCNKPSKKANAQRHWQRRV